MLKITIPQSQEGKGNVKDLIFSILSSGEQLSVIELTRSVNHQYRIGVTYQAVRKAVVSLLSDEVLEHKGRKYAIRKDWVFKLKGFADKLSATLQLQRKPDAFKAEMAQDYAVYTFNNLLDLDSFWGDMMRYWSEHHKPGESNTVLCYGHFAWWLLINLGAESRLAQSFVKQKLKCHFLFLKELPLNHWAAQVYSGWGWRSKVIEDASVDPLVGVNVLGDTVIQVRYPKNLVEHIKKVFLKNEVNQIAPADIARLVHTPGELKFIVFKNPTIANALKDKYLKEF